MSVLLVALFVLGILAGLFLRREVIRPRPQISKPRDPHKLDMVDDMVLYGEVTNDDFYGM